MSNMSLYTQDTPPKCIFRETFNSEQDAIKNGCSVSGGTFRNGIWDSENNGGSSQNYIRTPNSYGMKTIRIVFKLNKIYPTNQYI